MTPRSWEHWIDHYEAQGYQVLAPAYPGFDVEVEALNADPSPIEALKVPEIIERLEGVVSELETPPILIGHSAGGVFMQILLDHGFGAAGVAINSAPTEGVKRVPLSQIRATFPVLRNPANRHRAVGLTPSSGTTRSRTRFDEESPARRTSATTSRRRAGLLGKRARQHPSRPRRQLGQLQERSSRAAPVHRRDARTTSCRRRSSARTPSTTSRTP